MRRKNAASIEATAAVGRELPPDRKQEVFIAIKRSFAAVELRTKKAKTDTMLLMSFMLLSLRVAIEKIFRQAFPAWFSFEEGVETAFKAHAEMELAKKALAPHPVKRCYQVESEDS